MDRQKLEELIDYIIKQGIEAIKSNTDEKEFIVDYVAVFAKDKNEFDLLDNVAKSMGKETDKETVKTGYTYLLHEPIKTPVGFLKLVKIRFPDPTRPQRGAPDFKIKNYEDFKNKYIKKSGNFTLMLKEVYEMIEIKGVDVLVYIPSNTLGERMKKI